MLTAQDILAALERLGQLAQAHGQTIRLLLVGGAVMTVVYQARPSTRDVDAVILAPHEARLVRALARMIAAERGWPDAWLNDAAKG
jgi:predicted nucleotidyltransferase